MAGPHAFLLPGAVLPADLAYGALIDALGPGVTAVAKDLELYAGPEPPAGYGLDHEIAAVLEAADRAGVERFHLVGYSGGGAVSIALAERHPERLLSLALLEPAWTGNEDVDPREQAVRADIEAIMALPPPERMARFVVAQLRPGVEPPPPPPGPPPDWMAKRPAGLAALVEVFRRERLDPERLRAFAQPVYYALGARSNPDAYELPAARLARLFPDFTLDVYDERHHFDPPHRVEPQRVAAALRAQWARAAGR